MKVNKDQPYYAVPPSEKGRINFVKELVNINSGRLHLNNFSKEEISCLMQYSVAAPDFVPQYIFSFVNL